MQIQAWNYSQNKASHLFEVLICIFNSKYFLNLYLLMLLLYKSDLFIFLFYVCGCPGCMSLDHIVQSLLKPEEGIRSSRIIVRNVCKLLHGCRELSLCPLKEQLVLLTTDPYLQPLFPLLTQSLPKPKYHFTNIIARAKGLCIYYSVQN